MVWVLVTVFFIRASGQSDSTLIKSMDSAQFHARDSQIKVDKPQSFDSIPELPDYKLSYEEFMSQYGTDDSSRALINMFFRKRSFFAHEGPKFDGCDACGSDLIILGCEIAISSLVLGIRAGINCSIFTRKDLLFALLDYQNGYGIPPKYVKKIRRKDWEYHNNSE
jgi:hypothetical protein